MRRYHRVALPGWQVALGIWAGHRPLTMQMAAGLDARHPPRKFAVTTINRRPNCRLAHSEPPTPSDAAHHRSWQDGLCRAIWVVMAGHRVARDPWVVNLR